MDVVTLNKLNSKEYDKRKQGALDVERHIRDALISANAGVKVKNIVMQLVELASSTAPLSNARNGGIMGLAGAAIALGQVNMAPYLGAIAPPILACFHDSDSRVRYFACEAMYNVAKVAKGEILIFFNELFDAMSKLAADVDNAVKNGGELLDRLIKDIVTEQASTYVSIRPLAPEALSLGDEGETQNAKQLRLTKENMQALSLGYLAADFPGGFDRETRKAFSLARFVPLLAERIYVINPFTRTYLVSWVTVLDSIPELELVSYLPEFLDGLLKFLGDPTEDIRNATMHVLADFLKEIREAAEVARMRAEAKAARLENLAKKREKRLSNGHAEIEPGDTSIVAQSEIDLATTANTLSNSIRPGSRRQSVDNHEKPAAVSTSSSSPTRTKDRENTSLLDISEEEGNESREGRDLDVHHDASEGENDDTAGEEDLAIDDDAEGEGSGSWVPGQDVHVDHAAIVAILLRHLSFPDEEIQATCLRWMAEFLLFAKETMVEFTPRLIPVILSSLAHHVPAIRQAALQTNYNLFKVVQQLPPPPQPAPAPAPPSSAPQNQQTSQQPQPHHNHGRKESISQVKGNHAAKIDAVPFPSSGSPSASTSRLPSPDHSRAQENRSNNLDAMINMHIPHVVSPAALDAETLNTPTFGSAAKDPFDYQATVNALTLQFLNENEETRVAALQWLSMLHQKAPKKILSMHDGTFPALLKTLSDPSEDVIKADLQLLAQISSSSEEDYFPLFMGNLLSLFSTDRKLLETRGSLIIRQLCISLNTERIYRTLADLLEKDEDLEFASIMVQNLHLIMITSPELSDFRRRLKNLESKDGQILFSTLYRSWSHNAVAAFSLCLLAQAYEHAANLLQIFADLEVTVSLLIQIDKLVQLLESPVFTSLRLQLLEPEKNPYIFKCLYGLLMLLPQSSAFLTLRNRLNAVSPLGFLHVAPKPTTYSGSTTAQPSAIGGRSTIRRGDEIKWQELLTHFRQVQLKHERARRAQHHEDAGMLPNGFTSSSSSLGGMGMGMNSAPLRSGSVPGTGMARRKERNDTVSVGSAGNNRVVSGRVGGARPTSAGGGSSRPMSPQSQGVGGGTSVGGGSARGTNVSKRLPNVGKPRMA